jgi:hypothetical protein
VDRLEVPSKCWSNSSDFFNITENDVSDSKVALFTLDLQLLEAVVLFDQFLYWCFLPSTPTATVFFR